MLTVAVIGLGRFGYSVAETLVKKGSEVLAIDSDESKIEAVSDFATYAVECNATDEKALKAVSTQNVDAAVVSIGENIEASILIVMALKELGIKHIYAKAVTSTHGKVLENLGVTRVIYPERDAGMRLARSLISPKVLEHLELAPGYCISEFPVPDKFAGKTLGVQKIRTDYHVNIVAILRKVVRKVGGEFKTEESFNMNPSANDLIEKGDILVVIGRDKDLDRLSEME
jgi:trk system potassium uptake protein